MSSISAASNVDLSSQVSVAVAKKSLDVAKSQGDAVVQMIKNASAPAGKAGRSSPAPGRLDVIA